MREDLREQALAVLRIDEDERKYAYDDADGKRVRAPKGSLTIGVGVNLDAGLDDAESAWLTRHRLEGEWTLLMAHLAHCGIYLALLPLPAQLALALMAYQLGAERLMRFRKMVQAIQDGDWGKAADEALDSEWARETSYRAARVAALLRGCAGKG